MGPVIPCREAHRGQVRLRLQRGQQGPQGSPRWQGREPCRDDEPRAAGAARVHDHDRGLSHVHAHRRAARRARGSRSRWPCDASRTPSAGSLGDFHDPLLVSVRSGAKFSMPGMMETVLNIGLNDASVQGLAQFSGDARFAWDSYRRLIQMFGKTVLDIDGDRFAHALDSMKKARASPPTPTSPPSDLRDARGGVQGDRPRGVGPRLPAAPARAARPGHRGRLQLVEHRPRAAVPPQERISNDLGTAVNIVSMVFGNLGDDSGTGVCFTRDPSTGPHGRLRRLPAERAGRGRRLRASATPCRSPTSSSSTPRPTASCVRRCAGSRRTTATCATSSSRWSAASCGCCRPAWASGRPPRPSGSPRSSSTSTSSRSTRRSSASRASS